MDFIFDPSLVLYLPLYELDGASFVSRDKHGHLCTVTGALWRPNGHYFDGTDDFVNCGDDLSLGLVAALTVEAWLYPTVLPSDWRRVLIKGIADAKGYQLLTHGSEVCFSRCASTNYEDATHYQTTSVPLAINNWHHVVGVYDGSFAIYVNGVEQSIEEYTSVIGYGTGSDLLIGKRSDGFAYTGLIGEVRINNRGLTPQESQHNYLATKWRYR